MSYLDSALCKLCNNPRMKNCASCKSCLKRNRQANATRRKFRKQNHLCVFCGKPARKDRTTCVRHAGKYKKGIGKSKPIKRSIQFDWTKAGYVKLKEAVFKKYGSRCSNNKCFWVNSDKTTGCTDTRCLQIDHIFGGGVKEHRKINGFQFWFKVLKDQKGLYQLLCANCNWIKRHTKREEKLRDND